MLLSVLLSVPAVSYAAEDHEPVFVTDIEFPDPAFAACVEESAARNNEFRVDDFTDLDCSDPAIYSVEGIEFLSSLLYVTITGTRIESIDLSHAPYLWSARLVNNQLTELIVSGASRLNSLSLSGNRFITLSLSDLLSLEDLYVGDNPLESLSLNNLPDLSKLNLSHTLLTTLDLADFTDLYQLYLADVPVDSLNLQSERMSILDLGGTRVTDFDAAAFPNLTWLNLDNLSLGDIEFSGMSKLKALSIKNSQLETITLTELPALRDLYLQNNQLTEVDLSDLPGLQYFFVQNNQLSSLDLSTNEMLYTLDAGDNLLEEVVLPPASWLAELALDANRLSELDLTGTNNLRRLDLAHNLFVDIPPGNYGLVTEVNLLDNPWSDEMLAALDSIPPGTIALYYRDGPRIDDLAFVSSSFEACVRHYAEERNWDLVEQVTYLHCPGENIDSAEDLSLFPGITNLTLSDNRLQQIDLSHNPELRGLSLNNNQLTSIDLSVLPKLNNVKVDDNQLQSLDLSDNLMLGSLYAAGNDITDLTLNNQMPLSNLDLTGNRLVSLDLSEFTSLTSVWLGNNRLESLVLPGGNILRRVGVAGNSLQEFELPAGNGIEYLDLSHNQISMIDLTESSELDEINLIGNPLTIETTLALAELRSTRFWPVVYFSPILLSDVTFADENFRACVEQLAHSEGTEVLAALDRLDCPDRQIAEVSGLQYFEKLHYLDLSGNQLTELDLYGVRELYRLDVADNSLTSLDVSELNVLQTLYASHNQLTEVLGLGGWALRVLDLSHNRLNNSIQESLQYATSLQMMYLNDNEITELELSNMQRLVSLRLDNNQLIHFGIAEASDLFQLVLANNALTSLDLAGAPNIKHLHLENNRLANLVLAETPGLMVLTAAGNDLSELDLAPAQPLRFVDVSNNLIQDIDISLNSELALLLIRDNPLSAETRLALDIAHGRDGLQVDRGVSIFNPEAMRLNLPCVRVIDASLPPEEEIGFQVALELDDENGLDVVYVKEIGVTPECSGSFDVASEILEDQVVYWEWLVEVRARRVGETRFVAEEAWFVTDHLADELNAPAGELTAISLPEQINGDTLRLRTDSWELAPDFLWVEEGKLVIAPGVEDTGSYEIRLEWNGYVEHVSITVY